MTESTEQTTPTNGGGLASLKLAQLQALASQLGIAGGSRMRKADLVTAISDHQRGGSVADRDAAERAAQAPAAPAAEAKPAKESKAAAKEAAPAAAPSGPAVFPNAVDPKYAKETPGKARMHTCVDQYNANKATNANGGMKWIEKGGGYYSECSKKLKGAA